MSTPHDALVKRVLTEPQNAIAEIRAVLPAPLAVALELDALKVTDRSFVDATLASRHTDLLYEVPFAGTPGYVYVLIEHQSEPDPLMPLRLLGYLLRIWETHTKKHPGARELPPIIPLVLHHGESGWRAPLSFHALFPEAFQSNPAFRACTPDFTFLLDDLAHVSNEALRARRMSEFAELAFWLLRDARSERFLSTIFPWAEQLHQLERQSV